MFSLLTFLQCILVKLFNTSSFSLIRYQFGLAINQSYLDKHHADIFTLLKVFTNEKRGGLRVISFDRSPFKLFSQKFSKKSVQAPSCKRPRTAPRTLFVSFASNNCFQIAV
jgi:hypothetical protein